MYLLLLLATALSQQPSYPQWNPYWYTTFTESSESWALGNHEVSGIWYYDSYLNISRMDRSSGRWDPFCGGNEWFMFFDTPCTHLVNAGVRYLYYPSLGVCCNCCSESDGCGILKPTWLTNATYIGTFQYNNSISAFLWNQEGNSPNFYWETNDANPLNRQMLQLDNGFEEQYVFTSPRNYTFSVSVFNVPTYCSQQYMCDSNSVCADVRTNGAKSQYLKYLKG